MEILSLCSPWLFTVLVILFLVFIFHRRWKFALGTFVVCMFVNLYFEIFPLNLFSKTNDVSGSLKVMSFNCNGLRGGEEYQYRRNKIIDFIRKEQPDVIFLTENYYNKYDSVWSALSNTYIYHTRKKNSLGSCLYSKYPIKLDTTYMGKEHPYSITYVKIAYKCSYVNFAGCHLSSNNYTDREHELHIDSVNSSSQAKSYLNNILDASVFRKEQAEFIKKLKKSRHPSIILGDFNDISGSPSMTVLSHAGFADAWWNGGFGYGATINHPLPYRIDHIFYNDKLKLHDIRKVDSKGLSDHDALFAEFEITK